MAVRKALRSLFDYVLPETFEAPSIHRLDKLTDDELRQINEAMSGIRDFEPLIQNEMIPLTRELAQEFIEEAGHAVRGRAGGPLSSGDEYEALLQSWDINDLLNSPLFNAAERNSLGSLMGPAVVGTAATGAALAPEDAEAAPVTGLIKNVPEFVNRFNRMVDQGYGGRNEIAVGEKLMHDPDLVNYDAMSDYALQHDGVPSGPFWKEQLAAYNDQIMEHGGLSNAAKQHWSRWYNNHLNRELGSKGREGRKDVKYSKPPPQPKNNAMALALAAAAGAGATGASAQEHGFPSWEEVSRDPTAPLPPPTWGESMGKAVDNLFHVLDMPATGLQGLARTGWGLLSGESFDTAASHGADVVRGGIDAGAERLGNYTLDKTGSPEAATLAHVLGIMASPI